jgi:transcriptional regulator with XRE-family HTH domain
MTSLRSVLAINMKVQRHILGLSQAKLAEKGNTSAHYIGMIELERKFPTPEMLERIAATLEIDGPDLFSKKWQPEDMADNKKKFRDLLLSDITKVICYRLQELDEGSTTPKDGAGNTQLV